jgi:hypothetical protein
VQLFLAKENNNRIIQKESKSTSPHVPLSWGRGGEGGKADKRRIGSYIIIQSV